METQALENKRASFKAMSEDKTLKKWMDTQDVLFALQISARTLQNYQESDVENLFESFYINAYAQAV